MRIVRFMIRVLVLPVWLALWLTKWVWLFLTSCSAIVFRILAGIFFLTAVAGFAFGLEDGANTGKSLLIAFGTFMIPVVAGGVLAGIAIAVEFLKEIVWG